MLFRLVGEVQHTIAVNKGIVNVPVARLESVLNGLSNLIRVCWPCSDAHSVFVVAL